MTKILVTLSDFDDRIVTIAKAHYGVKSKSAAIQEIIQTYAEEELELRPEFLEKLRKRSKERPIRFKNPEELRKIIEKR